MFLQGGLNANPFAALQSKDPLLLCCSDWDQGWTPNAPAPTPAPEVVQPKANLGNHGDTAMVRTEVRLLASENTAYFVLGCQTEKNSPN